MWDSILTSKATDGNCKHTHPFLSLLQSKPGQKVWGWDPHLGLILGMTVCHVIFCVFVLDGDYLPLPSHTLFFFSYQLFAHDAEAFFAFPCVSPVVFLQLLSCSLPNSHCRVLVREVVFQRCYRCRFQTLCINDSALRQLLKPERARDQHGRGDKWLCKCEKVNIPRPPTLGMAEQSQPLSESWADFPWVMVCCFLPVAVWLLCTEQKSACFLIHVGECR